MLRAGLAQVLLDSLLALQPRTGGASSGSKGSSAREDLVMTIATDLLDQVSCPLRLASGTADRHAPLPARPCSILAEWRPRGRGVFTSTGVAARTTQDPTST